MLKYISSYFLVLGCVTHLLCCGVPFFLSLITLFSSLGLSSIYFFDISWFETIEPFLLILTTLMIIFFIFTEFNFRKLDCVKKGECDESPCHPKKKIINLNLNISLVIYFINLVVFSMEALMV